MKQQATWHECKVLEGQSYIVQDNFFLFFPYSCIKVWWKLPIPSWIITYLMLWNNKLFDMNVKFWKDNLNSTGYLHTSLSLVFVSRFSDYCQLPFLRKEPNSKWLTCLNRCALKHQITFQEMFFKSFLCFNILSHREQA